MKTDSEIERDVRRELANDSRTYEFKADVQVSKGVVTITGSVPSYSARMAVQNAVHRVNGVLDVANEIEIRAKRPFTDAEIAHAVRSTLRWAADLPEDQIETTVANGWVTLEGMVDTLTQKRDAESVVQGLLGVRGVINSLGVQRDRTSEEELRSLIKAALDRRADREANRFRIKIKDGEVSLYGKVHSWQERKAVVGSIIRTKGVRKINDELRVDPYF
jgi:osmotically-inducible protein OsmY